MIFLPFWDLSISDHADRIIIPSESKYIPEGHAGKYSPYDDIVLVAMIHSLWVHVPLIIASNILVIAATYFIKQLHTPDNLIIGGVAVMDLLTGVVSIPLVWSLLNKNLVVFTTGSKTACYMSIIGTNFPRASLAFLFLMCVERFIAIKYPFKYHKSASRKKVFIAMTILLVVTFLEALIAVFNPDKKNAWKEGMSRENNTKQCEPSERLSPVYKGIIVPIIMFCQIFISLVLTLQVAYIARKQIDRSRSATDLNQYYNTTEMKIQHLQTKIAISLMFIFVLFWTPMALIVIVDAANSSSKTKARVRIATFFISLINSWVNAIVYAISKPTYRKAYYFLLTHQPWNWPKVNLIFRTATFAQTDVTFTPKGKSAPRLPSNLPSHVSWADTGKHTAKD